MTWVFACVVVFSCAMLGAAMVFVDNGIFQYSTTCALGSLVGFLTAYQLQSRYSLLNDD